MTTLKFGTGNTKLIHTAKMIGIRKARVLTFSLPAGHACPAASICHSRVEHTKEGKRKIVDYGGFRCYATKAEAVYTATYNARQANHNALKSIIADDTLTAQERVDTMAELINRSIKKTAELVRIHDAGDFFNKLYFLAWVKVAEMRPNVRFFAYTKMLPYAVKVNELSLDNFFVQYSYGGLFDTQRDAQHDTLPTCYVITDEWTYNADRSQATNENGVTVDIVCDGKGNGHQDYLAIVAKKSFGIPFH